MLRLPVMLGPAITTWVVLLAAGSSAAVTNVPPKGEVAKLLRVEKISPALNRDSARQESVKVRAQSPSKRHIRKFDFDAEFASYLGLASQDDTARFVAGDKGSSYKAPAGSEESFNANLYPPHRIVPGSTPASFAYFTQIYPDENSEGDIRIEHFSPVIHPLSSERKKARYRDYDRDEDDESEQYERTRSNYYPSDIPLHVLPTSRSYFGRYSSKQQHSEPSEDEDYGPKPSKAQLSKQPYRSSKGFDDDTPDYKMGYRQVGMYHKFTEEDLYPKKTSSEWIPLPKSAKSRAKPSKNADLGFEPDDYNSPGSAEDFHVKSVHDDEVTRIKTNIENDPPYSTNNFDLADKKEPSFGKLKPKATTHKGVGDFGKGFSQTDHLAETPFEPLDQVRKHKRRRKKHRRKHHRHHQGRPAFRSSAQEDVSARFKNERGNSEYKAPSFEFHNPVNSFVSPPYTPPEVQKSNLKADPQKLDPESYELPSESFKPPSEPYKTPSEPYKPPSDLFQGAPESDIPVSGETDKDGSFEEPSDTSDEPADVDYGPVKLDDLDEDYHVISDGGPKEHSEHSKDFDKRLPQSDDKVYGSFETFDSQLNPSDKKFDPFVQYPFDEQRKKLKTVVDELIESGKSR